MFPKDLHLCNPSYRQLSDMPLLMSAPSNHARAGTASAVQQIALSQKCSDQPYQLYKKSITWLKLKNIIMFLAHAVRLDQNYLSH